MPTPIDPRQQTPSMPEVIRQLIEARLANVFTALPGRVVTFNKAKRTATVQIEILRKYKSEETAIPLPPLASVPVVTNRTLTSHFKLPDPIPGDPGMVIFSSRSLDKWFTKGIPVDPESPRKFHLSDGTFWPGLAPLTNPLVSSMSPTSAGIENGLGAIEVTPTGQFRIGNGVVDVLGVIDEFIDIMTTATTIDVVTGPEPLDPATLVKLAALKIKLGIIKK